MPLGNATEHDGRRSATRSAPWLASRSRFRRCSRSPQARSRFVARFEEELAPKTVAAFRAILPLEDRIIHCRWSGESNWIPWGDRDLGIGPENATSYPHPGELALYPGGESETELLFPYGYCNFASKAGQLWANHFATLVEGQEQLQRARPADALGGRPADRIPRGLSRIEAARAAADRAGGREVPQSSHLRDRHVRHSALPSKTGGGWP